MTVTLLRRSFRSWLLLYYARYLSMTVTSLLFQYDRCLSMTVTLLLLHYDRYLSMTVTFVVAITSCMSVTFFMAVTLLCPTLLVWLVFWPLPYYDPLLYDDCMLTITVCCNYGRVVVVTVACIVSAVILRPVLYNDRYSIMTVTFFYIS